MRMGRRGIERDTCLKMKTCVISRSAPYVVFVNLTSKNLSFSTKPLTISELNYELIKIRECLLHQCTSSTPLNWYDTGHLYEQIRYFDVKEAFLHEIKLKSLLDFFLHFLELSV